MTTHLRLFAVTCIAAAAMFASPHFADAQQSTKPLKVFILVGQSNMQGHAHVRTFERMALEPKCAPMLKDMLDADGNPRVVKNVWISEIGSGPDADKERHGQLDASYGVARGGPNIGPEYTFGLYLGKHLDEPILIIKTAWGGKSLNTDFRSPGAGPYQWNDPAVDPAKKKKRDEATGVYYRKMMEHVKKVLADPGRVCPAYDKKAGYEIAGMVWFQGWNDMVDRGTYPNRNKINGYALYTELMAHFIRDVRKELNAPKMPFVIGVLGVGGPVTEESQAATAPRYRGIAPAIRKAMSDPAKMPQFKGNVAAVMTDQYWDSELEAIEAKYNKAVRSIVKERAQKEKLSREETRALEEKLANEALTPRELKILRTGKSNQGYHYLGSGMTMTGIGKGFADAMADLLKTAK